MLRAVGPRQTIQVERPGRGLLQLKLSRPDRSNALSPAMIGEIDEEIAAAERDASVRLIALLGEGKHFCAGADLAAAPGGAHSAGSAPQNPSMHEMLLRWDRLSKPTVALVQGACLGAGLALASCCDLVIGAPDAFFAIPEVRLGMVPRLLPFFVRAIGYRAFRRYGLSGERFSAATALSCGLVSEILETAEWDGAQARLLDSFLHAAPDALGAIKAQAARFAAAPIDPDQFLSPRAPGESAEAAEGKASFKEKRKPNWYIPE